MIMNVYIYISLELRPMLLYASTHFPGATAYSDGRFGQGTGPIVMDEVRCTSNEVMLMDCPSNLSHNCGHHQDAGVQCVLSTYGKIIMILIKHSSYTLVLGNIYIKHIIICDQLWRREM